MPVLLAEITIEDVIEDVVTEKILKALVCNYAYAV